MPIQIGGLEVALEGAFHEAGPSGPGSIVLDVTFANRWEHPNPRNAHSWALIDTEGEVVGPVDGDGEAPDDDVVPGSGTLSASVRFEGDPGEYVVTFTPNMVEPEPAAWRILV